MKRVLNFCSVLCGITAVSSLIMGISVLLGKSFLFDFRVFGIVENGTFFGFIGNVLGTAISCIGFGLLAWYGFGKSQSSKRSGFIYGLVMTGICLVSMIASIIGGGFTLGNLFIFALPAVYTYSVLKTA